MKSSRLRNRVLKSAAILGAIFFGIVGVSVSTEFNEPASASSSGPSPSFSGAPGEGTCIVCHGDFELNSGTGGVVISGLPRNYAPGQEVEVTVTVSQSDAVVYGFQMTAVNGIGDGTGEFSLPAGDPAEMQIVNSSVEGHDRSYISHNSNGITPVEFGSRSWTFTWTAPASRQGKIDLYAAGNAANSNLSTSGDNIYTTSASIFSGTVISNFFDEGHSNIAVYRPSTGVMYALNSNGSQATSADIGQPGDRPVPGDYDGDGITDHAVWRPSNGTWYVRLSSGSVISAPFGMEGDIPVPADYDGDLKTDMAIWRPSSGYWFIYRSSDIGLDIRQFGLSTDIVAPGDYDGDAKADIAVFRPSTGVWYIWRTTDQGYSIFQFGIGEDRPVQADFDGDGRTDAAIFRPSTGTWWINGSSRGVFAAQFGLSSDVPAPADYDGDGSTDIAVYRHGTWYILRSSDQTARISSFGSAGDIPVASAFIAQ